MTTTDLSAIRMTSADDQEKKLGGKVTRSTRNKWAESIEEELRTLSPLPISYDVTPTQPRNFSEFGYTEICGGFWLYAQSREMTTEVMRRASLEQSSLSKDKLIQVLSDKYELTDTAESYKRVCFLPGTNMLNIVSQECVMRLVLEEPDVMFKPHPLTHPNALKLIKNRVGGSRVIDANVSGFELLTKCEIAYTTAATEMSITGTALGKQVVNIGNVFNEKQGSYYPISRWLLRIHTNDGVESAQQLLLNMIDCQWSGLLFPWQEDYKERAAAFYRTTIAMRTE